MSDTTFSKSGMAMPGHPIPRTNDRTTVYRQNPGSTNSPNTPVRTGDRHSRATRQSGADHLAGA
jgi:hypothetical protein